MSVNYAAPQGRLVLPVDAPREDWLRMRLQGVGGTDVATITGANRYQTPFEAWSSKLADAPEEVSSEAMWWGTHTEALTVTRFEDRTGLATRRAGTYASRAYPHHLVNPDRFTADGGVLEVKDHESLSEAGKTVLRGEITAHAWTQLMWACHVTGRSHGWFAAKVGKQTVVLGPFPRDDDAIARMITAANGFWQHVQDRTPPPIDWATLTPDEVSQRFPVATPETSVEVTDQPIPDMYLDDLARLEEIRGAGERFDAERAEIETRLKALIGDREYLTVEGRPVLRWQPVAGRRSFDKAAAVARLAELEGRTPVEVEQDLIKAGAPTRRLSVVTEKKKEKAA